MKSAPFPFSFTMLGQESKLRGLYLAVSCEAEFFMSRIMSMIEAGINDRHAKFISLPFEMGAKLKRCKKCLQDYNLAYYNFYEPQFDIITELVGYRNMLAHGHSSFDENEVDTSYLTITWVEGASGNRSLKSLRIDIMPMITKFEKYSKLIFELYKLDAVLVRETGGIPM